MWAGLALAQTAPPATQTTTAPTTTQGAGRGGFVPSPVVIGPPAPVPPEVAIPRPTSDELAQVNGLVRKFIDGETSSNKALLKKFEASSIDLDHVYDASADKPLDSRR